MGLRQSVAVTYASLLTERVNGAEAQQIGLYPAG